MNARFSRLQVQQLALFFVALALVSAGAFAQDNQHPTAAEKTYIGAAGGYLKTQNEQGMKVARAMAEVGTGDKTLEQLKKVIKDARFVTNAGYEGDYLLFGKLVVPSILSAVDTKIRNSHKLRDAAFAEYLTYWRDGNTAHIGSGSSALRRSEEIAQEATKELTAIMRSWRK